MYFKKEKKKKKKKTLLGLISFSHKQITTNDQDLTNNLYSGKTVFYREKRSGICNVIVKRVW